MQLYIAGSIRGLEGDDCPQDTQERRMQLVCEQVSVLRERFPAIDFFVPHENHLINRLYAKGYLDADNIIETELEYIREECDGVVSIGEVHYRNAQDEETGVYRELSTAKQAGKLFACLDGISDDCCAFLARKIAEYESLNELPTMQG